MIKKLTRTGNSMLVLGKNAEVEVSTNGQIITPKRSAARDRRFRKAADKINRKYAGLFKRLSE